MDSATVAPPATTTATTTTATTTTSEETNPIIKPNSNLQDLYNGWESRIGYYLLLGNTRHHGYWDKDTNLIYPVGGALRKMEEKMFESLNLPPGSNVLDAGCGVAHVALYMAARGLNITAVDVMDHHLEKARRNVSSAPKDIGQRVTVKKMDYHHLETIPSESLDGAYTMETFVHATEPEAVLAGFYRTLRPGGHLAMYEYDLNYESEDQVDATLLQLKKDVEHFDAMPTWHRAKRGYYEGILKDAGFVDIVIKDYSENIRPMLRLFWVLAVIPAKFIKLFRLQKWFINAVFAAQALKAQKYWRYVAITARKPDNGVNGTKESE